MWLIKKLSFIFLSGGIAFIRFYQWIVSPILHLIHQGASGCRFHPSCSEYAVQAIQLHRFQGFFLILKRIVRCNPFTRAGYDPVPLDSNFLLLHPTLGRTHRHGS